MEDKINVLLVEDNQLFRMGLSLLLQRSKEFGRVITASNGRDALRLYQTQSIDVVITDIHMPLMNGIETVKELKRIDPKVKVLAITSQEEDRILLEIVHAGASGFILKGASEMDVVEAAKAVYAGTTYFPAAVFKTLANNLRMPLKKEKNDAVHKLHVLTKREIQILRCIAEEMTNKEIAAHLYISPRTVDTHRRNLLQKLDVKNTAGLVRYYLKLVG